MNAEPIDEILDHPVVLSSRKQHLEAERQFGPPPRIELVDISAVLVQDPPDLNRIFSSKRSGQSPTKYLVLAATLGIFGVDRFVAGRPRMGILKILTAGGLGVWHLIDVALILTGKYRVHSGLKLRHSKKFALIGSASFIVYACVLAAGSIFVQTALIGVLESQISGPPELTSARVAELSSTGATSATVELAEGSSLSATAQFGSKATLTVVAPDGTLTSTTHHPGKYALEIGEGVGAWKVEMGCEHSCTAFLYLNNAGVPAK